MWFAGIDWADQHHDVVIIDSDGRQVASKRVDHTKAGLETLVQVLENITGPLHHEQVACIVETKHGLLIAALLEARFPVYPVNPKTIDRRRGPSGAKTDLIDAYLLAKTGRSDLAGLCQLQPDSPLIQELKTLTRDQEQLIQMQTRLVNQLTACRKRVLSGRLVAVCQTPPTLHLALSASVPHAPGGDGRLGRAAHQCPQRGEASSGGAGSHQGTRGAAPPQLTADPITTRTKSRLMLALGAQLLPLLEQIAAYDEEIAALFLTHADRPVFASLPGAGQRIAPRLLAEWVG